MLGGYDESTSSPIWGLFLFVNSCKYDLDRVFSTSRYTEIAMICDMCQECPAALNFANEEEAELFYRSVVDKIQTRQRRMTTSE